MHLLSSMCSQTELYEELAGVYDALDKGISYDCSVTITSILTHDLFITSAYLSVVKLPFIMFQNANSYVHQYWLKCRLSIHLVGTMISCYLECIFYYIPEHGIVILQNDILQNGYHTPEWIGTRQRNHFIQITLHPISIFKTPYILGCIECWDKMNLTIGLRTLRPIW